MLPAELEFPQKRRVVRELASPSTFRLHRPGVPRRDVQTPAMIRCRTSRQHKEVCRRVHSWTGWDRTPFDGLRMAGRGRSTSRRTLLLLAFFRLAPVGAFFEEVLAFRHRLINGLGYLFPGLVLAKKLFAHEKHSYTEAIPGDVLMVPVAGADLLAILNWIAAQRHSGTVAIAIKPLVVRQPLLHHLDNL